MKIKLKKRIGNCIKVTFAMIGILGATLLSNVEVAKAEKIIHTHIWATKRDTSKHWEYCTVCGATRGESAHSFKDNWKYGQESCWVFNYSVRVCSCGYSYEYHKPCSNISDWISSTNRLTHHKSCNDCKAWTER